MRKMKQSLDPPGSVTIWCGPSGEKVIDSDYLVPGDVLEIPPTVSSSTSSSSGSGKDKPGKAVGWKVPADAVLLSGACIVNESSLSGTL